MSCSSTGSPTPTPVVNATLIGGRLPMPLSSSGVVLLAHADEIALEDVVRAGWPQPTPHALPDARALRDLLATVRWRGYAALDGHIHPDSRGVAVPVLGPLGSVYAALSVVVPNDDAPVQRVVEVLKVAAAGIGRELRAADLPDGVVTGDATLRPLISTSRATLDYFASIDSG